MSQAGGAEREQEGSSLMTGEHDRPKSGSLVEHWGETQVPFWSQITLCSVHRPWEV